MRELWIWYRISLTLGHRLWFTKTVMNDQSLLLAHLENLNRLSEAWVAEDPKARWASTYIVDLDHWAKEGVFTVADFIHRSLVCDVYEATRSAFGYKPSGSHLMGMTNEELEKESKTLERVISEDLKAERDEEMAHNKAVESALVVHHGFSIGELVSL